MGKDSGAEAMGNEALRMRNNNMNHSPAKILDNLTRKINGMAKKNIKDKNVKMNLIKLTKSMKQIAQKSVNESDYANTKARDMWKDAASQMEAEINLQLRTPRIELIVFK